MQVMVRYDGETRVSDLLLVVACVACNLWLFRHGVVAGLIGLNVTKHVAVAVICRNAGVNQGKSPAGPPEG